MTKEEIKQTIEEECYCHEGCPAESWGECMSYGGFVVPGTVCPGAWDRLNELEEELKKIEGQA